MDSVTVQYSCIQIGYAFFHSDFVVHAEKLMGNIWDI